MTQSVDSKPPHLAWPVPTYLLLLVTGLLLSVSSFLTVINMPDLTWHPARDAELQATYAAYQETGILLIKPTGSGSNYTQAPSSGPWTTAAWDDDPAVYVAASILGKVTNSISPYEGIKYVQASLVAIPLIFLPLAVGRLFQRARAGYALLLIPPTLWLVNKGTVLIGTEYGLFDNIATLRVYALYGISASLIFLSLAALLLTASFKLTPKALVVVALAFGVLAGLSNLTRALSGISTLIGVGVIWWLNSKRPMRLPMFVIGVLISFGVAFSIQSLSMKVINDDRAAFTGQSLKDLPNAHGTWHPLYLGLSYPQPITGEPSPFGIIWSDEFGWNKVWEVNPDALIASYEYDSIVKTFFVEIVKEEPLPVIGLYLAKFLYVVKQFGAMITLILLATVLALYRKGPHRRALTISYAIATPAIIMGLIPPVLVMPMLYYYSELAAGLGLLVAMSLGAIAWSITSLPAYVRNQELERLGSRGVVIEESRESSNKLTVVIPCRNGETIVTKTIQQLVTNTPAGTQIVVVENGSTDQTWNVLTTLSQTWNYDQEFKIIQSEPGLGNALREGLLVSTGARVLMTADDLPFGFSDLEEFVKLDNDVVVAVGSKAHPLSNVYRTKGRTLQSRVFRFMREAILQSKVGDSQGTLWVDGDWGRSFALFSRETGLMWSTELILAAEQQGLSVTEVAVSLDAEHKKVKSRFGVKDAFAALFGFIRLAIYKDDYAGANWISKSRELTNTQL